MGLDINMYVERNFGGRWTLVKRKMGDPEAIPIDPHMMEFYQKSWNPRKWIYQFRDYDVFKMLAGIEWDKFDDHITPIAKLRGLPEDVFHGIKRSYERYDLGSNLASYLRLDEILNYSWDSYARQGGYVKLNHFEFFLENGYCENYCGYIGGTSTKEVSHDEMKELLKKKDDLDPTFVYYTFVTWEKKYKDIAKDFYTRVIPALKRLSKDPHHRDVRITFYFS